MDKEYTFEMMWEDLNNGYEIHYTYVEINIYYSKQHKIVTHKNYYQIMQKTRNQECQC